MCHVPLGQSPGTLNGWCLVSFIILSVMVTLGSRTCCHYRSGISCSPLSLPRSNFCGSYKGKTKFFGVLVVVVFLPGTQLVFASFTESPLFPQGSTVTPHSRSKCSLIFPVAYCGALSSLQLICSYINTRLY